MNVLAQEAVQVGRWVPFALVVIGTILSALYWMLEVDLAGYPASVMLAGALIVLWLFNRWRIARKKEASS